MESGVYPLKEAEAVVGIGADVLRVMLNRGDIVGIRVKKGAREIWALTQQTVDLLLDKNKVGSYQSLVDEWVLEQTVGTHSRRGPLSPHTIKGNLNGLKRYWEKLKLDSTIPNISPEGFRQVMLAIPVDGKCHYATRRAIYDALCSFYHFLIRKGLKSKAELGELQELRPRRKTPERRTVLKPNDLQALLRHNESLVGRSHFDQALMGALIMLYFGCGLRKSEVIGLTLENVNLDRQEMHVLGKGQKYRDVGVPDEVVPVLKDWLKEYRPKSKHDNFFLQANGRPLTPSMLQSRLTRLKKRAGIDITYHGFRRGFATLAVQEGDMLPTEVQLALGHSDLRTTEKNYLMTEQSRAVRAMKRVKLLGQREPFTHKRPAQSKRRLADPWG